MNGICSSEVNSDLNDSGTHNTYAALHNVDNIEKTRFDNGPEDRGSIPGRVIPKTKKLVLNATLLNTQHYKERIKGKVELSRERSRVLHYTLV